VDDSAVVIVATVGKPTLRRTIESILSQTYDDVTCLVVVDGPEFAAQSRAIVSDFTDYMTPKQVKRLQLVVLPQNTGSNGFVCHRIYGAMPMLVNQDFVFYCDDDNWYDPDHVKSLVHACIENEAAWSHSFRNIYKDGEFICRDECESIGQWPVWYGEHHHVDTNCYCLRRELAVSLAPRWHKSRIVDGKVQPSADTEICNYLIRSQPDFVTVPQFTVNYELGSWALSPKPEFFAQGNAAMSAKYGANLPWE
jgi:glycosyltransferase involved in cell wall biosynthesis